MTTIVLAHKHFDAQHLAEVKNEMVQLGAPTVTVIWWEMQGVWVALEGCHRLRAAHALGLTPTLNVVEEWDDDDQVNKHAPGSFEDPITIGELLDAAHNSKILDFEDESDSEDSE